MSKEVNPLIQGSGMDSSPWATLLSAPNKAEINELLLCQISLLKNHLSSLCQRIYMHLHHAYMHEYICMSIYTNVIPMHMS